MVFSSAMMGFLPGLDRRHRLVGRVVGVQPEQHLAHEVVHHAEENCVWSTLARLVARVVHDGAAGLAQILLQVLEEHRVEQAVGAHDAAQGLGRGVGQLLVLDAVLRLLMVEWMLMPSKLRSRRNICPAFTRLFDTTVCSGRPPLVMASSSVSLSATASPMSVLKYSGMLSGRLA
jgi:hypothetical protein